MNVGDLTVRMAADLADLKTGVQEGVNAISGFARDAESAFNGVKDAFGDLAAALGVSISIEFFQSLIEKSVEAADKLRDLANYTGSTVEALSALKGPADIAGISMDSLGGMLAKLSTNLSNAQSGSGNAAAALSGLGFTSTDVANMLNGSPTDALIKIAGRLNDFQGSTNKAAYEQAIFGKGSFEVANLVAALGDSLTPVVTVTTQQANAAHDARVEHEYLNLAMTKIVNEGIASMLPQLTKIASAFVDITNNGNSSVGFFQTLSGAFTLISGVAAAVWTGLKDVGEAIGGMAAIISIWLDSGKSFADKNREIGAVVEAVNGDIDANNGALTALIPKLIEQTSRTGDAKDATEAHRGALGALHSALGDVNDAGVKWVNSMLDQITAAAGDQTQTEYLKAAKVGLSGLIAGDYISALQQAKAAHGDETQQIKDAAVAEKTYFDALGASINQQSSAREDLLKSITTIETETATLGMSDAQRQIYITGLQLQSAMQADVANSTIDTRQAVSDLTDKMTALNQLAAKQDLVDAAKASDQAWNSLLGNISSFGEKVFVDLFENGKTSLQNLTDTLKKTLLQALYDLTVKPWVISIAATLTGATGSVAQAAIGGGVNASNVLTGGGGLGGIGNLLGGLENWFSNGGIFGSGLGASFAGSSLGQSLGLSSLAEFSTGGTALTGLGTALGVGIPILGIVGAIAGLSGLFSRGGGPKQGGTAGPVNFYPGETSAANNATMATSVQNTLDTINQINSQLGSTAYGPYGYSLGYDTDPQGTAQSRVSSVLTAGGQTIYNARDVNAGRSDSTLQAQISSQIEAAVIAGVQATNLAQPFKDLFGTISTSLSPEAFNKAVQQIVTFKTALDGFSDKDLAARFVRAATVNPQAIESLTSFATAYGHLDAILKIDPKAEAMTAVANAQMSSYGAVLKMRDGLGDLLSTYDGSTAATAKLTAATADYVQAQINALAQIEQLKTSISGMFGNSIEQIQLSTMTTDQKIAYYRQQAAQAQADLSKAVDPADIERLSRIINSDLNAAWQLLDPAQQAAQQHQYILDLNAANQLSHDQLDHAAASITQANTTQQTILEKIQQAVDAAADKFLTASANFTASVDSFSTSSSAASDMTAAASTMVQAADTMQATANTPITVHVDTQQGP